jgi:hypothetical protein
MRPHLGRSIGLALLVVTAVACASKGSANASPKADRNEITQAQILEHHFVNAYEAVQALHSNWLQTRGTDSFNSPGQVWVYLDETKLGGVETLRSIAPAAVAFIRHFDGLQATARWGIDHGQGVIFVSSHR